MNALAERNATEAANAAQRRFPLGLVLALLAGLLVAHIGCHGDEDNELFLRLSRSEAQVPNGHLGAITDY